MKTLLAVLALLTLAACSGDSGQDRAVDPGGSGSDDPPSSLFPVDVPVADGPVRTRALATVMDTGHPELCLGAVAESWPPQCGGPIIRGWDWQGVGRGMFERSGDVRWGQYAVTGTWDGEEFTVTDAVPAALYDPMVPEEPTYPAPARDHTPAELEEIAEQLSGALPGIQGAAAWEDHVLADVIYDDGSLQAYVDETYGEHVVIVTGALVDAG